MAAGLLSCIPMYVAPLPALHLAPRPLVATMMTATQQAPATAALEMVEPVTADEDDDELSLVLDRATAFRPMNDVNIILPFNPSSSWLWQQYKGTILEVTWKPTLYLMLKSALLVWAVRASGYWTWPLLAVPDPSHPIVMRLKSIDVMWNYLLTLATFVSSFFVSQAYPFWRGTLSNTRKIQGRFGDFNLLLAGHALRAKQVGSKGENEGMVFTPKAHAYLTETARLSRLAHILFWASVVRKARGDFFKGSLSLLSTDIGLKGLEERGEISSTSDERKLLEAIPPGSRHHIVFGWMMDKFQTARDEGLIGGGNGLEGQVLQQLTGLRGTCASINDDLAAPMPLAYVHFVQIMTDVVLLLAPFALFPRLGALSILLSGILGLFYRGLLELSKSFLDPFGNEGSIGQNLVIDCLMGEVNAGSVRWVEGGARMP